MPDYTIVNLKTLEDAAAAREYDIEARFGREPLGTDHLGISYFRYGAGYRAPFGHRHQQQEEAYIVISGSGRIRLEDQIVELRQWDVVRVAPGVLRGLEGGPDGIEFLAIGSDRPEGGDAEMVPHFWTD
jgi:mannose-6-phosphate isomerase-like protein (cupin superfamily)